MNRCGQGPAVTYRAELSGRALKQMHELPGPAFESLIEAMAEVMINDGAGTVIILDITWVG